MERRRRSGIALPAGRKLSLAEPNLFSKEDYEAGTEWSVNERQNVSKNEIDLGTGKTVLSSKETWLRRRGSIMSMTMGSHERLRRKHSFQLAMFASRTHSFLQQDLESHLMVVLGFPGVGKTALIVRYITGRFVHEYDPTLEMTYEKQQEVGNIKGVLRIMDTAGSINSCLSYIRQAEGIVVVYSITDRHSFETAKEYLRMIKEYARLGSPFDYELPTILVGNKRELRRAREVSRDEARQTANEYGCLFVESSAAYDRNVQKIFINLFLQIHRIKEERQRTISNNAKGFVNSVKSFFLSRKR